MKLPLLLLLVFTVDSLAQATCSADAPCAQGCCSIYGNCGFGPSFCGAGNCTSTCDAVAECGQYAPANSTACPLNVCCSKFGFCGTTADFCGDGCQNGCDAVVQPSCSGTSSHNRRIGYFESWSRLRPCDGWNVTLIDTRPWTHINYAFAMINDQFGLSQMNEWDTDDYAILSALKSGNPGLKIFISVGGWAAGGAIFSQMAGTEASRQAFIQSTLSFLRTYNFDGVDIDWEYPAAPDRGGIQEDKANFVTLCRELKTALGSQYGLSLTIPTSYWYLRGFDVVGLARWTDWFNYMAYDIHGTWDGDNPYTQAVVQPHTNLTEIATGLDLLWRNKIDPAHVVLGLGFYGRSFTLSNPSCKTPGCPFSGGGDAGNCTQTSGILSNAEISRIISQEGLTPMLDDTAAINYISWDHDQWVSYDNDVTFNLKADFANSHCLSGLMAWAIDMDNPSNQSSALDLISDTFGPGDRQNLKNGDLSFNNAFRKLAGRQSQNAATNLFFWTECSSHPEDDCPYGTYAVTGASGKIYDADMSPARAGSACYSGIDSTSRALCVQQNIEAQNCGWYGIATDCRGSCPSGYILVTANDKPDVFGTRSCAPGRYAQYCCSAISQNTNYDSCDVTPFDHALSGGLAPRAPVVKKGVNNDGCVSCNILFGLGESPDGCEECSSSSTATSSSATETSCDGCQVLTTQSSLTDSATATQSLVPRQYPTYSACNQGQQYLGTVAVALYGAWQYGYWTQSNINPNPVTIFTTVTSTATSYTIKRRTCNGISYPDACMHYRSVISKQGLGYAVLTCPPVNPGGYRPVVNRYTSQHTNKWVNGWTQRRLSITSGTQFQDQCDRDEWPPVRFRWPGLPFPQWLRLLSRWQNVAVANDAIDGWNGVCPARIQEDPLKQIFNGPFCAGGLNQVVTCTYSKTEYLSWPIMSYTWANVPNAIDDGLTSNFCWPSTLTADVGFALLTDDPWYTLTHIAQYDSSDYRYPPAFAVTAGKFTVKRDLGSSNFTPEQVLVNEGNSSRKATDEELLEHFGLMRCASEDCEDEIAGLGPDAELQVLGSISKPRTVQATLTSEAAVPTVNLAAGSVDMPAARVTALSSQMTARAEMK